MASIESLVEELNQLCKQWITDMEQFSKKDRIFEILKSIKEQGYSLSFPRLKLAVPEYDLLSVDGKNDFDKLMEIRNMKAEAIGSQEFERAADLRDEERSLIWKIQSEFESSKNVEHFILSGKMHDIVIFNDPDNVLISLIK